MSEIVHLVLPNEFDPKRRCVTVNLDTKKKWRDPRKKTGELLCPDRLNAKATARIKKKMVGYKYALQFNQDPKAGGGQILKREFWKVWKGPPPMCEYIFSSWDCKRSRIPRWPTTAHRTDWGLFYPRTEEGQPTGEQNLILFGALAWPGSRTGSCGVSRCRRTRLSSRTPFWWSRRSAASP